MFLDRIIKIYKPGTDHWLSFSVGVSGCGMSALRLQNDGRVAVEFYISDDKDLYHSLYAKKNVIEEDTGFALDWRELPEKKASRILVEKDVNLMAESEWPEQFDWIMDAMVKIKKAFKKQI